MNLSIVAQGHRESGGFFIPQTQQGQDSFFWRTVRQLTFFTVFTRLKLAIFSNNVGIDLLLIEKFIGEIHKMSKKDVFHPIK